MRVKNVFKYKGLSAIIKKWYRKILFLLEPGHKRGDRQRSTIQRRMNSGCGGKERTLKHRKIKGKERKKTKS